MRKIVKMFALAMIMVFSMTTIAMAKPIKEPTAQDLQKALSDFGVPSKYIGNVVEHLQKVKIKDKDAARIEELISEAKKVIGSSKDISSLSNDNKNKLQKLTIEAAGLVGTKVEFGKDSKGVTTMTVKDLKGNKILTVNTIEMIKIVKNFNVEALKDVVQIAVNFSNNPHKNKFEPITGKPNQTATPYGNTMAMGLGLIALSGIALVFGRKKLTV